MSKVVLQEWNSQNGQSGSKWVKNGRKWVKMGQNGQKRGEIGGKGSQPMPSGFERRILLPSGSKESAICISLFINLRGSLDLLGKGLELGICSQSFIKWDLF